MLDQMSEPKRRSPAEWGGEFGKVRGSFIDFTKSLETLLEALLEHRQIEVAALECRTKKPDSFIDKIVKKNEKYADPLREMTDLTGARIIVYYPADVARVDELIEAEFDVDWENSSRAGADVEPERFGYRSDHYVVSMNDRGALAEWKRFDGFKAEIQVRTVMQHAWAAVDHKLRYKREVDIPQALRRRLSRLSALLEVADEQFAAIR